MMNRIPPHQNLAQEITKAASQQTYYTIRFLVDRERVTDAYRAYAYFRWVDDTLDVASHADQERIMFLKRQKSLLEQCYQGKVLQDATAEENLLIELVQHDPEKNSGLQTYLRNMMHVMEFDTRRRGRWISQAELNEYTRWLATAVTEAMHYFIGRDGRSPHDETRYLAVTGAHITHMLRDTFDDIEAGYYNIPREVLIATTMQPGDVQNKAYLDWVQARVQLARACFKAGRAYLSRVENWRCRLAGFAYTARFEWLLDTLQQEGYVLRPQYSERKRIGTGLKMGLQTLSSMISWQASESLQPPIISQSLRKL